MKTQNPPKFRNKNGELSAYAFACGYVQQKDFGKINLSFYHEGGNCYSVQAYDFGKSEKIFWDSFEKLGDARKRFRQAVKELSKLK